MRKATLSMTPSKSGALTIYASAIQSTPIRSYISRSGSELRRLSSVSVSRSSRCAANGGSGGDFPVELSVRSGGGLGTAAADVQSTIIAKRLKLFVVDADRVASEAGSYNISYGVADLFFCIVERAPSRGGDRPDQKPTSRRPMRKRGETVLQRNFAAVDRALEGLREVQSAAVTRGFSLPVREVNPLPDFVERVTKLILDGRGDRLPVSALPVDGTFPTGTSRYEKAELPTRFPSGMRTCASNADCALSSVRMRQFDQRPIPQTELEGAQPTSNLATGNKVRGDIG